MEVKERRRKVEELYNKGMKIDKIAKRLNVSAKTVIRDINFLEAHNEGMRLEHSTQLNEDIRIINKKIKEDIPRRREEVAKLYNQGKGVIEIAKLLGVKTNTINQDIKVLAELGAIERRDRGERIRIKKREKIAKRREQVINLYKEGKTQKEIAEELGVSVATINIDIRELIAEGVIHKTLSEKIARREKVVKLYREGKTQKEIAEELGVAISTINTDIRKLITEGVINKRQGVKVVRRRKQVVKLYEEGKTQKEIAEELGVSITTIKIDIRELITEGKITSRQKSKKRETLNVGKRELHEKMEELANKGLLYGEIADILGVDIADVINYLKDKRTENRINRFETRRNDIRRLFLNQKLTIEEISAKLGISENLIKEELLMMGIVLSSTDEEHEDNIEEKDISKEETIPQEVVETIEDGDKMPTVILESEDKNQQEDNSADNIENMSLEDIISRMKQFINEKNSIRAVEFGEQMLENADGLTGKERKKLFLLIEQIKEIRELYLKKQKTSRSEEEVR